MIRRPPRSTLFPTRRSSDLYQNGLDMYTDASYSRHDPTSSYKDVSQGASIEWANRSEEHTSELQSPCNLVCRLLLEKKKQACEANPRRRKHLCHAHA